MGGGTAPLEKAGRVVRFVGTEQVRRVHRFRQPGHRQGPGAYIPPGSRSVRSRPTSRAGHHAARLSGPAQHVSAGGRQGPLDKQAARPVRPRLLGGHATLATCTSRWPTVRPTRMDRLSARRAVAGQLDREWDTWKTSVRPPGMLATERSPARRREARAGFCSPARGSRDARVHRRPIVASDPDQPDRLEPHLVAVVRRTENYPTWRQPRLPQRGAVPDVRADRCGHCSRGRLALACCVT